MTEPKPVKVLPITGTVACERYAVTKAALRRAVKQGMLTDHRRPGSPSNAALLLDEGEVAARLAEAQAIGAERSARRVITSRFIGLVSH